MTAPTPHASAPLVPKEAAVAPHPKSPDNVLLGLCTRFSDRMREWIRVAANASDVDVDAHQKEGGDDQVRELWELWWSDFGRIRQLHSQTVAGAIAKHRIAKSLCEWSRGTDGTWTDFLSEACDELESRFDEAFKVETQKSPGTQKSQSAAQPEKRAGLLHRFLSMF